MNPIELHDQVLNEREYRFIEHIAEDRNNKVKNVSEDTQKHLLPFRSLNEVFIGEALSARVSYYKMSINDSGFFKQKSSGLLVCTGTGSTSWCYNINKISHQSTRDMIDISNFQVKNEKFS
jgi:NAD+ kinase